MKLLGMPVYGISLISTNPSYCMLSVPSMPGWDMLPKRPAL